ncbi:hypothetical protein SAMN05428966_10281 [Massilia sp. PDC64]|nr:hypothetical protein [Massilia sp. PDC64]SDC67119.1 hypothetical protein SAMN05428966_10281 [Massilia sp. PDC64]
MDRFPYTAEARAERLIDLTRECADTIKQALAGGLPKTTTLIDEALGDYMQDDHARAELLRRTAAGENAFADVLADLIDHEASLRAEQELQREEKRRANSARDNRIEQRVFERFFSHHRPA